MFCFFQTPYIGPTVPVPVGRGLLLIPSKHRGKESHQVICFCCCDTHAAGVAGHIQPKGFKDVHCEDQWARTPRGTGWTGRVVSADLWQKWGACVYGDRFCSAHREPAGNPKQYSSDAAVAQRPTGLNSLSGGHACTTCSTPMPATSWCLYAIPLWIEASKQAFSGSLPSFCIAPQGGAWMPLPG